MSWTIDTSHSQITFAARHMMLMNVRGRFEQFTGTVDFNEENPKASSVYVEIDAASLTTQDANRDGHLKSPDFLDVANYPTLTFKSTRVEPSEGYNGRIYGDLTVRGVTREVALDVEFLGTGRSPWGQTVAGFSAKTKINRKDFGLTWNVALETGGVLVGEDITINIEAELVKQAVAEGEAAAA